MKITERKLRLFICEAISREQFKVPAEWLTREVLEDIGNAYVSQSLPITELGGMIWDKLHDFGIEELHKTFDASVKDFYTGSVLHRWFVIDAIQSAELLQQSAECKEVIEAARAWVNDPSEKNRIAARAIRDLFTTETSFVGPNAAVMNGRHRAAIAASDAAYYFGGPGGVAYVAVQASHYASNADPGVTEDAWRRMLVLAALDVAGILPAPKLQETL